jgi:hypothetical protein
VGGVAGAAFVLPRFGDTRCEAPQFRAIEDFGVNHADQQFFH